jgi:hypothetical protein
MTLAEQMHEAQTLFASIDIDRGGGVDKTEFYQVGGGWRVAVGGWRVVP